MLETALERHGVWMRWHRMGLSDPARSYSNISNVSQSGPAHAPRREIHVFE
jgi:hypothetical protein